MRNQTNNRPLTKHICLIWITMLTFSFGFQFVVAQTTDLSIFDNLMNKTWKAEGKWGNGGVFKQEVVYTYSLDSMLVIAQTKGFTDKEQTIFGPRNHGIRKVDMETGEIKFWEFDIFGGVTKGNVFVENGNLFYQYQYGESVITDCWEKVTDNVYKFKVGVYKDEKWQTIYLETQFTAYETDKL